MSELDRAIKTILDGAKLRNLELHERTERAVTTREAVIGELEEMITRLERFPIAYKSIYTASMGMEIKAAQHYLRSIESVVLKQSGEGNE